MVPPAFQSSPVAEALPQRLAGPTPAQAEAHADDMRLLRRYVDQGSQVAFSQLTAKHLSWVYAMCRRTLRDKHLAEDASQAVFVLLARRAASLSDQTRVAGWLFNTTRFVLRDVRKSEGRFQRRQGVARELARDRMLDFDEGEQDRIDPRLQTALDEGLALLGERDRQALMTHFYEGLTLAQMADRLGITRDGAKKRVGRALARLRALLGKGKGETGKAGGKGKKTGLSLLALAMLLRGRDAGAAVPSGLFNATVAASTIPGAAPAIIEQILSGVAIAMNVASKRLLHALLAGQGILILVVIAAISRSPETPRVALAPARSASPASTGSWTESYRPATTGGVAVAVNRSPSTGAGQPDVAEPPYRSGADDPDPDQKKPTPEAQAAQPKMLASSGEGVSGGALPAGGSNSSGGTIYAGVSPVPIARAALPTPSYAMYEPRPFYSTTTIPLMVTGGRSSNTGGASPERIAKTDSSGVTSRGVPTGPATSTPPDCRYSAPPMFAFSPGDGGKQIPENLLIPKPPFSDVDDPKLSAGGHIRIESISTDGAKGGLIVTRGNIAYGEYRGQHFAHPAAMRPGEGDGDDFFAMTADFDPAAAASILERCPEAVAIASAALEAGERPMRHGGRRGMSGAARMIIKGERSLASALPESLTWQASGAPAAEVWSAPELLVADPGVWKPGDIAAAGFPFAASEPMSFQATPTPEPTGVIGLITAALLYLPRRSRRK